jgi:hypothetical protein
VKRGVGWLVGLDWVVQVTWRFLVTISNCSVPLRSLQCTDWVAYCDSFDGSLSNALVEVQEDTLLIRSPGEYCAVYIVLDHVNNSGNEVG